LGCHDGFENVFFHMINCLDYVRSVSLNGAAFNPSWHLTAVGRPDSASRFTVSCRLWLSLGR
jgi:hypothetical protein